MRGWYTGIVILLLVCNGCIIVPAPSRTTVGHRYSKEALAFLGLPGMTKAEVISTLGPPDAKSQDVGTLAYKWEYVNQSLTLLKPGPGLFELEGPGETHELTRHRYALFIAFDPQGIVTRHQVVALRQGNRLQAACEYWEKHSGNK